jgi:hypothetical protein
MIGAGIHGFSLLVSVERAIEYPRHNLPLRGYRWNSIYEQMVR